MDPRDKVKINLMGKELVSIMYIFMLKYVQFTISDKTLAVNVQYNIIHQFYISKQ